LRASSIVLPHSIHIRDFSKLSRILFIFILGACSLLLVLLGEELLIIIDFFPTGYIIEKVCPCNMLFWTFDYPLRLKSMPRGENTPLGALE
jgi:hypothetical protein